MQEIDLIFQQYYRPLCLYATHYLHDIDEAEDVVQDCFVKFFLYFTFHPWGYSVILAL